jgi:transposase
MAVCGGRELKPRREVVGLARLTPTPYPSGARVRDQGITKSGNRHVRWLATELAWSGVRYPPESALSGWFKDRLGRGGKRMRRMGLVAVARTLLMALGRFVDTGAVPVGAARTEAEVLFQGRGASRP